MQIFSNFLVKLKIVHRLFKGDINKALFFPEVHNTYTHWRQFYEDALKLNLKCGDSVIEPKGIYRLEAKV